MRVEKVIFSNSRGLKLVGHLYAVGSDTVIIMCHGFLSNKDSKGRFPRLAAAFNASGFDALAFDFSGCGESEDERLTVAKEADDLQAAISFMKSKGYRKIALYGHSLGTLICLKCYSPLISTIAISGAATDSMSYNWNEFFSKEQIKELHETGYITQYTSNPERGKIVIDQQMLLDFEQVNQKELLKDVSCPVLIIHGNQDEEELFLYEKSKRAMSLLSCESKLEIIEGATHSFLEHYEQLIDLVTKWFEEHLNVGKKEKH